MIHLTFLVGPQCTHAVVSVGSIPENRSVIPLFIAPAKTASTSAHLAVLFRYTGKPRRKKVTIGTSRYHRAVIVPGEKRSDRPRCYLHIFAGAFEIRLFWVWPFCDLRHPALNNILLMRGFLRHRQRFCRRQFAYHHPKTCRPLSFTRQCRHPVR